MSRTRYTLVLVLLGVACQSRYVIGSEQRSSGGSEGTSSTGDPTSTGSETTSDAGMSSTGTPEDTGSDSSSSSSSSTGAHCAPGLGESICEQSLAETCCEFTASCVDDPTCTCILECRLEGHSLEACENDCGGPTQSSVDLHECSFDACDGCF